MAKRRARSSPAGQPPPEETPPAGTCYIESSALVAALLEDDKQVLKALQRAERQVTSSLTFAEAARAIVRARVSGRLSAEAERAAVRALRQFERRCYVVAITEDVLDRVKRPFPVEPVRTLDAMHLATVEILAEPPALVTVLTRDGRVRENAIALGYPVE